MVRRSLIVLTLCCMLAVMVAQPMTASAAQAGILLDYTVLDGVRCNGDRGVTASSDYFVKRYPVVAGETYRISGYGYYCPSPYTLSVFNIGSASEYSSVIVGSNTDVTQFIDFSFVPVVDGYIMVSCRSGENELSVEHMIDYSSSSVYDGNISSSMTTIFKDIAEKSAILDNYVFVRSSQYEYVMYVGDITLENGSFLIHSGKEYRLNTYTFNNSSYVFTEVDVAHIDLSVGTALVYSNLGHYPTLIDQSIFMSFATLLLLFIGLCLFLIRSIFSFTLRRR